MSGDSPLLNAIKPILGSSFSQQNPQIPAEGMQDWLDAITSGGQQGTPVAAPVATSVASPLAAATSAPTTSTPSTFNPGNSALQDDISAFNTKYGQNS